MPAGPISLWLCQITPAKTLVTKSPYTTGWQKEAGDVVPKALSICYVLGMRQETASPPDGTSGPGERTVYPVSCANVIAPMSLSPCAAAGKEREVVAVTSCSSLPSLTTCQNKIHVIPRKKRALLSLFQPPERSASTQHFGHLLCPGPEVRWLQPQSAVGCCRLLHTLKLLSINQPWNTSSRFYHPD